jgi:hypothetical protein
MVDNLFEVTSLVFGQDRERAMGTSAMCGTEVAFGAAVARRFGQGGLLARLGAGRRNVGRCVATTRQVAQKQKKPATGKYRGGPGREDTSNATR